MNRVATRYISLASDFRNMKDVRRDRKYTRGSTDCWLTTGTPIPFLGRTEILANQFHFLRSHETKLTYLRGASRTSYWIVGTVSKLSALGVSGVKTYRRDAKNLRNPANVSP